jgi:hypothetical protein
MYEFYRKDTDYGRTVVRREVERYRFECDVLRAFAWIFAFVGLESVAFIAGGVQYSWIITVFCLGLAIWLGLTNYFITEHKYKKYLKELKLSVEQKELEEIYNQETEKLKYELGLLEDKPLSELTLYLIDKRDKIKRHIEQ